MKIKDLIGLARDVLAASEKATAGPWPMREKEQSVGYNRLMVHSQEPWRRRPQPHSRRKNKTNGKWKEYDDVAIFSGGERGRPNAEFVSVCRAAAPQLAAAVLMLCKAKGPVESPNFAYGFNRILGNLADSLDDLAILKGGDAGELQTSDRNKSPAERLFEGDGKLKADVLRGLADVIDPSFNGEKQKTLHASLRLPVNGKPSIRDLAAALPAPLTFNSKDVDVNLTQQDLAEYIADRYRELARSALLEEGLDHTEADVDRLAGQIMDKEDDAQE